MTISIQNIINGALAIGVTLLIYQNTQLKDSIETLKQSAESNTDIKDEILVSSREDIDNLLVRVNNWGEYQSIQDNRHTELTETLTKWQESLEMELNNRINNSDNIDTLFKSQNLHADGLNTIQDNIKILDGNIKDINRRIELIREYLYTL
jgi:hypothetical protein